MSREAVYEAFEAMLQRWNGLRFLDHRDFYGVPQSASDARHWVLNVLSAHITASAEVLETVELLVSEVVTNSICTATPVTLTKSSRSASAWGTAWSTSR
ncbi:hypothetical protein ACQP10_25475 [Streptosporangium sandarakinum]|uniref:hypothetical protein n=1 Tax=Streptosporangium sandarakinum TaxID=1260955 RepID=UPI003D8D5FE6